MAEVGGEIMRQIIKHKLAVVNVFPEVRVHWSCVVSESKEQRSGGDARERGRHRFSERCVNRDCLSMVNSTLSEFQFKEYLMGSRCCLQRNGDDSMAALRLRVRFEPPPLMLVPM